MARVLVVAPHMDDEVLGLGGTICKHIDRGDVVKVLFVANRVYGHRFDQRRLDVEEQHALEAKDILGYQEVEFARLPDEELRGHFVEVITAIEKTAADFGPEIVYLNHRHDPHQDHKAVFEAGLICFRAIAALPRRLERVCCYEVPSSTDQVAPFADHVFMPNYFVDVAVHLEQKIAAMACYETESRAFPHPRSPEGLRAAAAARGVQANLGAAEGFMVLREIWA
jgi:N-acetylglucosamine malate deacetylase 1